MLIQEKIGIETKAEVDTKAEETTKKNRKSNNPNFRKEDKIKQHLKEWNTIENIELYEDLYNICSQLFNATVHHKLACLNYYVDHERDKEKGKEYTVMYAEIKDSWQFEMKERYDAHKELLERVMSNDITLVYAEICETQTEGEGQLSLFG